VPTWLTFFDGLRPRGQRWTLRVWLGVMVGMAGVALVARPGGHMEAGHWTAIGGLMLASIAWSIGSLYSQSVPRRLPLFSAAAVEMIAGAVVLVGESLLMKEDWGRFGAASPQAWLALLYLFVFGSLVGFTAFAFCLNELPASTVGTYAYVNPVVAVLLGSLFLGEPVSAGLVLGAVLILGAVLLTTARRSTPRPRSEAPSAAASEATSS